MKLRCFILILMSFILSCEKNDHAKDQQQRQEEDVTECSGNPTNDSLLGKWKFHAGMNITRFDFLANNQVHISYSCKSADGNYEGETGLNSFYNFNSKIFQISGDIKLEVKLPNGEVCGFVVPKGPVKYDFVGKCLAIQHDGSRAYLFRE